MTKKRDLYSYIGVKDEQIAYLIGAIMGDGSYSTADICTRPRFSFTSSDKDFALLIQQLVSELFDVNMNIYHCELSKKNPNWRDCYKMCSRILYKNLSLYLPDHKVLPKFIVEGTLKIKAAFISGFFDAEGGVSIGWIKSRKAVDRRIYCYNNEISILKTIQNYLNDIDIKGFIIADQNCYALNIWGFSSCTIFRRDIGFKIERKKDKLNKLIDSYKSIHIRGNEMIYNMVINLANDANDNIKEIKQKLLDQGITLSNQTIEKWISKEDDKNER